MVRTIFVAVIILNATNTMAQITVERSVIAGGGGAAASSSFSLHATVGEGAISTAAGGGFELASGFWGAPGLPDPCPADLAPPFGVLDLADITVFTAGFVAQNSIADLNDDGVFDLADINAFVSAFLAGCP